MLKNPDIIETGTHPAREIVTSLNKIKTDNIGLCHTCYSSGVIICSDISTGSPICKTCQNIKLLHKEGTT